MPLKNSLVEILDLDVDAEDFHLVSLMVLLFLDVIGINDLGVVWAVFSFNFLLHINSIAHSSEH